MEMINKLSTKIITFGAAAFLMVSPFCISSISAASTAGDVKVSVVNFKQCVERSKLGKQEQATFEGLKKQLEEVLVDKEKVLMEIAGKFNDPDYLDSLSPDAENELKHKYRTLSQELNAHQTQYYQALNQANFKIIQSITEEINKAAKTVAQRKGVDLVLNEESGFFYAHKLDLTNDVIQVMDSDFEKNGRSRSSLAPNLP